MYYLDIYLEDNFEFMFYDYDNQKALYSNDIAAHEGIDFYTGTVATNVSGTFRIEYKDGKIYISTVDSRERKNFNYK